jgi:hypothetical protein
MCDITKGVNGVDCKNATAGFKNAFIANYDESYEFTTSSDDVGGHTVTGLPVGLETFKFPLKNTGNNYNEPSSSSRDAGTTAFNGTVNLVFTKIDAKKSFQINQLVWGRPIVFLETNTGEIITVGLTRGVEFNSTANVEGALDGVNAYQLVGTSQEPDSFFFLDESAKTELLDSVVTPV